MGTILDELDRILLHLKEAQATKDSAQIQTLVEEMNKLWGRYSEEMKKNARADGFIIDDN